MRRVAFLSCVLIAVLGPVAFSGGQRSQPPADPPERPQVERELTPIRPPTSQEETSDIEGLQLEILGRPAWILFYHADLNALGEELSVTIERGYIPRGMEVQPNGNVSVLYQIDQDVRPRRWFVEDFQPENLNQALSERIVAGLSPVALSVEDGVFLFLFVEKEHGIREWRMHESGIESSEIASVVTQYQRQGFSLVDISVDIAEERLWYFFTRTNEPGATTGNTYFVNAYPAGESTPGGMNLDYQAARGMPTAFAAGSAISLVVFRSE